MLPKFPDFKKLELSDRKDIENLTSGFPRYSDFNFTSMWIWNIHQKMMISELNGNLVVLFYDYISDKKFLSFIGKNKISETADSLLAFSKKDCQIDSLKLVPEEIAEALPQSEFRAEPDRDSYDYVYSVAHFAEMNNWPKNSISKKIRRYLKLYPEYVVKHSSVTEIDKNEYLEMFKRWADNKDIKDCLELNEYKAFKRLLDVKDENIKIVSFYVENKLAGFNVYEILSKGYAISHFAKADVSIDSAVGSVLNWEEAKILNKQGTKYFNWEQDLGIQELRYSKEKYMPSSYLKKYIVGYKSDK